MNRNNKKKTFTHFDKDENYRRAHRFVYMVLLDGLVMIIQRKRWRCERKIPNFDALDRGRRCTGIGEGLMANAENAFIFLLAKRFIVLGPASLLNEQCCTSANEIQSNCTLHSAVLSNGCLFCPFFPVSYSHLSIFFNKTDLSSLCFKIMIAT